MAATEKTNEVMPGLAEGQHGFHTSINPKTPSTGIPLDKKVWQSEQQNEADKRLGQLFKKGNKK